MSENCATPEERSLGGGGGVSPYPFSGFRPRFLPFAACFDWAAVWCLFWCLFVAFGLVAAPADDDQVVDVVRSALGVGDYVVWFG